MELVATYAQSALCLPIAEETEAHSLATNAVAP